MRIIADWWIYSIYQPFGNGQRPTRITSKRVMEELISCTVWHAQTRRAVDAQEHGYEAFSDTN